MLFVLILVKITFPIYIDIFQFKRKIVKDIMPFRDSHRFSETVKIYISMKFSFNFSVQKMRTYRMAGPVMADTALMVAVQLTIYSVKICGEKVRVATSIRV